MNTKIIIPNYLIFLSPYKMLPKEEKNIVTTKWIETTSFSRKIYLNV